MKRALVVLAVLIFLATVVPTLAQSAAGPAPTPTQSTLSFSVGASALGLGGASQATAATDVKMELNPGFTGKFKTLELRSDNLLAPGANLQYYGGGVNFTIPKSFPKTSAFAPLSFYVDGTVGADRIVPGTGKSSSHIGFMAGGGLRWLTSSGVQVQLIEVNLLHAPGAPWGANAPAISGGLSYVFGHQ